jgi:hypothetical protein
MDRTEARRWLALVALAATGVIALIAALSGGSGPRGRHDAAAHQYFAGLSQLPPDPLRSGSQTAIGASTDGAPGEALDDFSHLIGARPKLAMWFESWDEPLVYPQDTQAADAIGAIPMVTWDPIRSGTGIPLSEIAAGRFDAYIRAAARQALAYGQRLYVRFGHEMNLAASPFGPGHDGDTPAAFIAAWRHVVGIFRQTGARNVEFVWSPNVYCEGHCPFTAFYPGDAWVDWVALDGYNYGPAQGEPWLSFARIFEASYAIITRLTDRPLMVGETASAGIGGSKAAWIEGMWHTLRTRFTRVRALIWFQRVKETDWRVDSSAASLAAFRAGVMPSGFARRL